MATLTIHWFKRVSNVLLFITWEWGDSLPGEGNFVVLSSAVNADLVCLCVGEHL